MQKSMQKKMVILKTAQSGNFEEVHLILRDNMEYKEDAMVEEANRIIADAENCKIYRRVKAPPSALTVRLFWFFVGIFTACGISALAVLIFSRLF